MRYTMCALGGLWLGSLVAWAICGGGPGTPPPAWGVALGAAVGAWLGAILGLTAILQPDEQYIETYGCPLILALLLFSLTLPFALPRMLPDHFWSLAYLLAPPLGLCILSSTVRTHLSPLLGLGMLAWVSAMLVFVARHDGLVGRQLWLPLSGVVFIFLAAGAARRLLRWQLPKMKGSVRVDPPSH